MSARIAPEPVGSAASPVADFRPRVVKGEQDSAVPAAAGPSSRESRLPAEPRFADVLPPLPPPPDPPGTMFAAAVIAGALSPKPETPEEIFLRLGSAWTPPDSELRLADRTI